MNLLGNKGIAVMSLIIMIVVVLLIIFVAIILINNRRDDASIETSRDVLPEQSEYYAVNDYGSEVQTEDRTLYIKHKEDVKVGDQVVLKKDEFCKVQKLKNKIISMKDILLNSGYQAWFIAYEDGTIERLDIIQDISKIKESPFQITSLPEFKDIVNFWSITRDGEMEVKARNSTGESFTVYTMQVD